MRGWAYCLSPTHETGYITVRGTGVMKPTTRKLCRILFKFCIAYVYLLYQCCGYTFTLSHVYNCFILIALREMYTTWLIYCYSYIFDHWETSVFIQKYFKMVVIVPHNDSISIQGSILCISFTFIMARTCNNIPLPMRWCDVYYLLDQNAELDFYYTNTLKQHIASVQQRSSKY